MLLKTSLVALAAALTLGGAAFAQDEGDLGEALPVLPEGRMTGEALLDIVRRIDPEAELQESGGSFQLAGRQMVVVFDETAGRMRAMSPIVPADVLEPELMERMLQANYDSVLDARYAVAQDLVWSVFIHPLASLTTEDFFSGLSQTVVAAETFGTAFTSGEIVFGGGDSQALNEELLEALERARGNDI